MNSLSSVLIISALGAIVGCSKFDPTHPQKAATHIVTLTKVQIGANDFNLDTFGNPLNIELILLESGKRIPPIGNETVIINGVRGERVIQSKLQWAVNFDPSRNYQIVLEEKSIIANAVIWSLPATPKIGYWPIGLNHGKLLFGSDSYLEFSDKIAE